MIGAASFAFAQNTPVPSAAEAEPSRQALQQDRGERLQRQLQTYKDRAATLSQRLQEKRDALSEPERRRLETEINSTEEQAKLLQLDSRLAETGATLVHLQRLADNPDATPEQLQQGLTQLSNLQQELQIQLDSLQQSLERFQQQQQALEQRETPSGDERRLRDEEIKFINPLLAELKNHKEKVQTQIEHAQILQTQLSDQYKQVLSKSLSTRITLPATAEDWQRLLKAIANTPRILFEHVKLSLESIGNTMASAGPSRWVGLSGITLTLLALKIAARRGLIRTKERLDAQKEKGFSGRIALFATELICKNLLSISLALALLAAVWILQIPPPGRDITLILVLLGISIKVFINLAWLLLVSPRLPLERRSPRLYRQWVHMLLLGVILGTITILAHASAVEETSLAVFDRVLMLYFLLFTAPVLRARRFILSLLAPYYREHYGFTSLRLLSLSLPLALLAAAIVGLAGFLNLAWTMAWYLAVFTLVLAGLVVVMGLLDDAMAALKNYAITHSSHGLLWTQEIITPFHKLLRILLLLGVCLGLLKVYGWADAILPTATWRPLLLAVGTALIIYQTVYILASVLAEQTQSAFGSALIRHSRQPMEIILPIAAAQLTVPTLGLSNATIEFILHLLLLIQIGAVTWLIAGLVAVMEELVEQRYRIDLKDNFSARRVLTQVRILRRIVLITVYVIAIAAILITFPKIRQFGTGLLASAGVAGLIIGVAARPLLENLIAGVQISLTQPIRIDDAVVVEGEFGRIAEISATYVVVHLWDHRQLIVPLNYFNTQAFQNWTRTSTHLLGSAFLYVDYTFPVEEGRQALKRILDESNLWDGKAWALQVTNASEQTMELRALMSAPDAPTAWDLRCYVRERFIAFLQQNYPDSLPRTRTVLEREDQPLAPPSNQGNLPTP